MIKFSQQTATKLDVNRLKFFFSTQENVIFAVIFGSSADGVVKPSSDVDIGVLFFESPPPEDEIEFYSKLCDALDEIKAVDFVNLNKAGVILSFEAINGKVICCNNMDKMAEFFSLVSREYEDAMVYLKHQKFNAPDFRQRKPIVH